MTGALEGGCSRSGGRLAASEVCLAVVAHELRNPLTPIRNGVEILRQAGGDTAIRERTLNIIQQQVYHLGRMVDDLLALATAGRAELAVRRERVDLRDLLRQVLETAAPEIQAAGLASAVSMPAAELAVVGDATRLTQVVANLLQNAIKFTPAGGQISLRLFTESGQAVLQVGDSGIGINADSLQRIFQIFFQAEPDRSRGGFGVGLALARELARAHGGELEAHSAGAGEGSVFELKLPLAPPA